MWVRAASLLALGVLAVQAEVDIPFTTCGDDNLGVQKVTVSSFPIHAGAEATLSVVLIPKEDVKAGKLDLLLSVRGVKIYSGTVDLCTQAKVPCPLAAGQQVVVTATNNIPKEAPPTTVNVHIVGHDGDGGALTCIDTEVKIERMFTREELDTLPAITGALIGDVLMSRPLWRPQWSRRFENATLGHAVNMCGTHLRGHPDYIELEERTDFDDSADIPESFDAREHWGDCKEIIGHIRDQSSCGSCWAFSTTEAFNDRLCIAKDFRGLMSPTDTAACCHYGGSAGCNGGQPGGAWKWFTDTGVVSGGDEKEVGEGLSCLPYPFPSCAHHVAPTPEIPACPAEDYATPRCRKTCSEKTYETDYHSDKKLATKAYSVRGEEQIQREMMERGPVSAALTVYNDLLTYKSGVYHHVTGSPLGGHAVKMIGWGVEDGTPYWLIANSWNSGWGDGGLFKILRGKNECGIESEITAGTV